MSDNPDGLEASKESINALAEKFDTDFLIFNYEILPPADFRFMALVSSRKTRRKNVILNSDYRRR